MKSLLKTHSLTHNRGFAHSRNNPEGFFFRSWNVDKTMSFFNILNCLISGSLRDWNIQYLLLKNEEQHLLLDLT